MDRKYYHCSNMVMSHFAVASSTQNISQQYTINCVAYHLHFSLSPTLLRLFLTLLMSLFIVLKVNLSLVNYIYFILIRNKYLKDKIRIQYIIYKVIKGGISSTYKHPKSAYGWFHPGWRMTPKHFWWLSKNCFLKNLGNHFCSTTRNA